MENWWYMIVRMLEGISGLGECQEKGLDSLTYVRKSVKTMTLVEISTWIGSFSREKKGITHITQSHPPMANANTH